MHYTYILQSEMDCTKYYYGKTRDLKKRILAHNSGQSPHTSKYKPWRIIWYGCFETDLKAAEFETYLKTASGKAFMRKHLVKL